MKSKSRLLGVTMFALALILLGGCATGKYIPKSNEEFYGTWINEHGTPKKSVSFAGGFKTYVRIGDTDTTFSEGTEVIEKKWKDSEGNVWYKSYGTITAGIGAGMRFQTLSKISKSGMVREWVHSLVIDYDPKNYPPTIDSRDPDFSFFTRVGN
jgi:hypothetical protein